MDDGLEGVLGILAMTQVVPALQKIDSSFCLEKDMFDCEYICSSNKRIYSMLFTGKVCKEGKSISVDANIGFVLDGGVSVPSYVAIYLCPDDKNTKVREFSLFKFREGSLEPQLVT
ncbi:MAG: hypothetical protein H6779_01330 [Candidatus Nomurabacteria bacterium]|nr:MAG: hypothetical protein H6779_01330 [Candidatus Nomurabacteria bacterium]